MGGHAGSLGAGLAGAPSRRTKRRAGRLDGAPGVWTAGGRRVNGGGAADGRRTDRRRRLPQRVCVAVVMVTLGTGRQSVLAGPKKLGQALHGAACAAATTSVPAVISPKTA